MKKAGFTLAEVLITLMILGIIAALTIPSLIQNTQKKEEVVQLKKGLSMINQAITMNYALDQEDLTQADLMTVLNKRLAVTKSGTDYVATQDGLTYYVSSRKSCTSTTAVTVAEDSASNQCFDVIISVRPDAYSDTNANSYDNATKKTPEKGDGKKATDSGLTGWYQFYAGADRVVPSTKTAEILYSKDATTVTSKGSV